MRYEIYEGNIERLEKKMTTIANKCKKFGCEFRYERVGEVFRKVNNDGMARFIVVEADGTAVIGGWEFVASVDYTENGNVIRNIHNVEIPERYRNAKPFCEHCNTKRNREHTVIIRNVETGEFKQIGKNCLKDFTGVMDAKMIAEYTSWFSELIEGGNYGGGHVTRYYELLDVVKYMAGCASKYGYVSKSSATRTTDSTASLGFEMYLVCGCGSNLGIPERAKYIEEKAQGIDFEAQTEYVQKAIEWLNAQEEDSTYMHNMKVIFGCKYIDGRQLGYVASIIACYNRYLGIEQKKAEEKAQRAKSEFVGEIKDRVTVDVNEFKCVTSWESVYGITYIYSFTDKVGNVYTWETSNGGFDKVTKIIGTVKAHNEYRGTKQTELTRCKVA